jgi:NOL1/NOP2/fmu family ribosome biogenesis protein
MQTAEAHYRAFCEAYMTDAPTAEQLALVGSYLYASPPGLPDLSGLRVIHPGWWLGVLRKNRFEPSHALALAITPSQARLVCNITPDDPLLSAFLAGQPFRSPGADGWILVTVDSYPVGWGKRSGGLVKSHYPKGLRRLQEAG